MPVLSNQSRTEVWGDWMRSLSNSREQVGNITKTDLRAAINAIDAWVEDNAASFNSAIPQPARANLSATQKAQLLALIALKRFGG